MYGMRLKMAVVGGVAFTLVLGGFGLHKANEAVQCMAESNIKTEISELYKGKVTIHSASGDKEYRNAEIFDISYDDACIAETNILNYRRTVNSSIQIQLKDSGLQDICNGIWQSTDSYYFEESITDDLKLVQTAKEKTLDTKKLEGDLEVSAVLNTEDYLSFDPPNNYEVEEQFLDICALQEWKVDYDNALTLGWNDIKEYVVYDGTLNVDSDVYDELAKKVADSYNTVGAERHLDTPVGKIDVAGGTYGWDVDVERESTFLQKSIEKRESVEDRTPAFAQTAYGKDYADDVGNKYVLVSIEKQHVWNIVNGKIKKESDCVTGTKGKHDTPTGVYRITEILPKGKVLKGEDYSTPVNKWIRLTNSGIGLHDAEWRGTFGGNIYEWSGSHGCINLPYDFANYLCEKLKVGMPVIIK